MLLISAALPALPGIAPATPRAPWPVWRNSIAGPVRWVITSRKEAARRWHAARRWDRETRQPGRHGGIVGRVALDVLYVLSFDFLNYATGRLDPSHEAIAERAGCCPRTVRTALAHLRDLGLLSWQRRCEEDCDEEGRFRLRQRTNAYGLLPVSQWCGYRDNAPPLPFRDALGYPEPVPDPIDAAVAELTHGQRKAAMTALETGEGLATALAGLGRVIEERETQQITGRQELPRNPASCLNHTAEAAPQLPTDGLNAAKAHWLQLLLRPDKDS